MGAGMGAGTGAGTSAGAGAGAGTGAGFTSGAEAIVAVAAAELELGSVSPGGICEPTRPCNQRLAIDGSMKRTCNARIVHSGL